MSSVRPLIWLVMLIGLALTITACTIGRVYRGTPLQADPAVLVEGQSTKSDVLRIFGPPFQITHQTDGDAFVYLYQQQNFASLQVRDPITCVNWFTYNRSLDNRDTLIVLFDFVGIVRSVSIAHHVEDMPLL